MSDPPVPSGVLLTLAPCSAEVEAEQAPLHEELASITKEKEELAKRVANLDKDLQSKYPTSRL